MKPIFFQVYAAVFPSRNQAFMKAPPFRFTISPVIKPFAAVVNTVSAISAGDAPRPSGMPSHSRCNSSSYKEGTGLHRREQVI